MANIWVAASDGNVARVEELLASGLSPNIKDDNSYTPMHAAASYGHLAMLDLLLAHGGDINLVDDDGDTPIYTAENVATARYLVEHGAIIDRVNNDGLSPIAHLEEEYPEVVEYLRGLNTSPSSPTVNAPAPSQYLQNAASEQLTNDLMASLEEIDQESEVPLDQQLQEKVGRTVIEGVRAGYELSQNADERGFVESSSTAKKQKMEESGS